MGQNLTFTCRVFCRKSLAEADAFQLCAYSSMPLLLTWIPVLGAFSWFWMFYLNWRGLVTQVGLKHGEATAIILLPLFSLYCIAIAAILFVGLAMAMHDHDLLEYLIGNLILFLSNHGAEI